MRTYTDTLRDEAGKPDQPRYLIAPGEPPEITSDPELKAAREKLIRHMAGIAWRDRRFLQKVVWGLLCAVSWLCGAGVVGFFSGFVLLFFAALTGVPPEGDYDGTHGTCPMCEFVIQGACYVGAIASTAFLAWALSNRERNIRRLHGLSNGQLIEEFDAWREAQRGLAAQEQHRHDLDYQAERIGYWTDHYSRRR